MAKGNPVLEAFIEDHPGCRCRQCRGSGKRQQVIEVDGQLMIGSTDCVDCHGGGVNLTWLAGYRAGLKGRPR